MSHRRERKGHHLKPGQVFLLFLIVLPVLMLFVGLALDMGFAYITKTTLSKSVDAAALAGMRNLDQGRLLLSRSRRVPST